MLVRHKRWLRWAEWRSAQQQPGQVAANLRQPLGGRFAISARTQPIVGIGLQFVVWAGVRSSGPRSARLERRRIPGRAVNDRLLVSGAGLLFVVQIVRHD